MKTMTKSLLTLTASLFVMGCTANAGNMPKNSVGASADTEKSDAHSRKGNGKHRVYFGSRRGNDWDDIDTNDDGKISREEWQNRENKDNGDDDDFFEKFDLNKDDYVTQEEIEEFVEKTVSEAMKGLDIKMEAMKALREEKMHMKVERIREKAERMAERAERIAERVRRDVFVDLELADVEELDGEAFVFNVPDVKHHMRWAGPRFGGFKRFDDNDDGVVTKAEFEKHQAEMFAKLDKNGDGKLDESDLPKRKRYKIVEVDEDDAKKQAKAKKN